MILIRQNAHADSRSCAYQTVTKEQLATASRMHIGDVREALGFFRERLILLAATHDADKITDLDGFHANFITGFAERDWLDRHYGLNKHHLDQFGGFHADATLLDVLDFVADQVMAAAGRGTERPVELNNAILQMALKNTVTLLKAQVQVEVAR